MGTSSINYATEIKVRAEFKLADAVDKGQESGVIATGRPKSITGGKTLTLSSLGVAAKQVSESRLLRDAFDEAEIRERAAAATEADKQFYRSVLLREARKAGKRAEFKLADAVDKGQANGTIAKVGQPKSISSGGTNKIPTLLDLAIRNKPDKARRNSDFISLRFVRDVLFQRRMSAHEREYVLVRTLVFTECSSVFA